MGHTKTRRTRRSGFTLIELMVVIAIITLLVAILAPSLQEARAHAKTVVCLSNMSHIGKAAALYLYSSNGVYPPSYFYPQDERGRWSVATQTQDHPFGYMHWSYFLYSSGKVGQEAFQCPDYEDGGAPRTNPGPDSVNWASGEQADQNGNNFPNLLEDKQAVRMSYTANAAIMPRNKFTKELSGGLRINRFVNETEIRRPGDTILVTEFLNNWKAIGLQAGNNVLSKSHRPINPFFHVGSGFDEYAAAPSSPGFIYGLPDDQEAYGLLPLIKVRGKTNILDKSSGMSQINAVGRHHPTADSVYRDEFGGSANFLFSDGHGDNMTVLETMRKRKWGNAYHSITGENKVLNMSPVKTGGGN